MEALKKAKEYGFEGCDFLNDKDDTEKIKKFFLELNNNNSETFGTEICNKMLSIINDIDSVLFHVSIAKRQRDSYNQMKQNLTSDCLLIELDYKQKVNLF